MIDADALIAELESRGYVVKEKEKIMTIKEIVEKCGRNHGGVVFDLNGRYMYIVNKRTQTIKIYLMGVHVNHFLCRCNYTLKEITSSIPLEIDVINPFSTLE